MINAVNINSISFPSVFSNKLRELERFILNYIRIYFRPKPKKISLVGPGVHHYRCAKEI